MRTKLFITALTLRGRKKTVPVYPSQTGSHPGCGCGTVSSSLKVAAPPAGKKQEGSVSWINESRSINSSHYAALELCFRGETLSSNRKKQGGVSSVNECKVFIQINLNKPHFFKWKQLFFPFEFYNMPTAVTQPKAYFSIVIKGGTS